MDQKPGQPMEPPPPYTAQPGAAQHMPPGPGFMGPGQPQATVYPAQPGSYCKLGVISMNFTEFIEIFFI